MEYIEVQQNTLNEKWAVIKQSDENDFITIVGGAEFDTKEEAEKYMRASFCPEKKFDYGSEKLIGGFEKRFEELSEKQFDRRSFYQGWLEGRAAILKELKLNN